MPKSKTLKTALRSAKSSTSDAIFYFVIVMWLFCSYASAHPIVFKIATLIALIPLYFTATSAYYDWNEYYAMKHLEKSQEVLNT